MEDFSKFQEKVQAALVATTRTVNKLGSEDLPFHRAANPSVGRQLDEETQKLFKISNDLLKCASKSGRRAVELEDTDDIDVNWKSIVDVIDSLLERADTCLDEYTGLIKNKIPILPTSSASTVPKPNSKPLESHLKRANILKPQNAFECKVDNFQQGPWKPILTSKPHAMVPLQQSLTKFVDEEGNEQYRHPYETEILHASYPDTIYQSHEPIFYQPVDTTSAIWVDTYEGVLEMLEELKKAKEIAVDLEHHDYRTYTGLLSLMQISTRNQDWIVDTLQPWRQKLEILNEVFADPSIIKVFHGANMDIRWLQRDLGLYIVGLFDTFDASEALGYERRSLAFLLKKFVDFEADKKYQLADWRIRPLPEEMLYYARSDTHYLLYVFDMVRNELLQYSDGPSAQYSAQNLAQLPSQYGATGPRNLLQHVLDKSKETALLRHEGVHADPETGEGPRGWYNALTRYSTRLSSEQFSIYKAVHNWRDEKARRDDENPIFILSQQSLMDIAKIMPQDEKALWSLLRHQEGRNLQPVLRDLFQIILQAQADGINGPSQDEFMRAKDARSLATVPAGKRVATTQSQQQEEIPRVEELRSEHSQLWGNIPLSSSWEQTASQRTATSGDGDDVALPWAQYVQGKTVNEGSQMTQSEAQKVAEKEDVETANTSAPSQPNDSNSPLQQPTEEAISVLPDEDEEFVLKSKKGRKRKAARQASAASGPSQGGDDDEEPFDYANAQSVLRAPAPEGDGKGGKKGKKAFDPFAKAASEGPKGARNLNAHKPGKSATFKK